MNKKRNRKRQLYERKGYSKSWIEQRERGIATRHNLTDEWIREQLVYVFGHSK